MKTVYMLETLNLIFAQEGPQAVAALEAKGIVKLLPPDNKPYLLITDENKS